MAEVFDTTQCGLGEGPLWHPTRGQLFWFDIVGHRLHTQEKGKTRTVQFDEHVSAAGWVDDATLLVASETRLFLLNLETEKREDVEGLEASDAKTRSNDGRADPWGGFWIGTMAKQNARNGEGAIYRYHRGELRKMYPGISIPNAICFSPDRRHAYFADTPTRKIMRVRLEADFGWPDGDPEVFLDLTGEGLWPDGAVTDAEGNFWNAQWGAGRVACYAPDGSFLREVRIDAAHTSCPAFGGPDLSTLFCTTALQALSVEDKAASAHNGMTFAAPETGRGVPEYRVRL